MNYFCTIKISLDDDVHTINFVDVLYFYKNIT